MDQTLDYVSNKSNPIKMADIAKPTMIYFPHSHPINTIIIWNLPATSPSPALTIGLYPSG